MGAESSCLTFYKVKKEGRLKKVVVKSRNRLTYVSSILSSGIISDQDVGRLLQIIENIQEDYADMGYLRDIVFIRNIIKVLSSTTIETSQKDIETLYKIVQDSEFDKYTNSLLLNYMKIKLEPVVRQSIIDISSILEQFSKILEERRSSSSLKFYDPDLYCVKKSLEDYFDLRKHLKKWLNDLDPEQYNLNGVEFLERELKKYSKIRQLHISYLNYGKNFIDSEMKIKMASK